MNKILNLQRLDIENETKYEKNKGGKTSWLTAIAGTSTVSIKC